AERIGYPVPGRSELRGGHAVTPRPLREGAAVSLAIGAAARALAETRRTDMDGAKDDAKDGALEAWHRGRGARFEGGLARDYGDPQAEARALREGAGLWDRSDWGLRRFVGAGRVAFLHNYLTQEVRLDAGRAAYACALT